MPEEPTASERPLPWERPTKAPPARALHLVLAWSLDEPERLGEAVRVDRTICLGRGTALADDPAPRCDLVRMRPGSTERCPPIAGSRISRLQLVLSPARTRADMLEVRSIGRAIMRVNG